MAKNSSRTTLFASTRPWEGLAMSVCLTSHVCQLTLQSSYCVVRVTLVALSPPRLPMVPLSRMASPRLVPPLVARLASPMASPRCFTTWTGSSATLGPRLCNYKHLYSKKLTAELKTMRVCEMSPMCRNQFGQAMGS